MGDGTRDRNGYSGPAPMTQSTAMREAIRKAGPQATYEECASTVEIVTGFKPGFACFERNFARVFPDGIREALISPTERKETGAGPKYHDKLEVTIQPDLGNAAALVRGGPELGWDKLQTLTRFMSAVESVGGLEKARAYLDLIELIASKVP